MRFLRSRESVSARALEFLILTASRSQEVRNAAWSEIDLQRNLWIVPADRMKAGREHLVPLSTAAISLLGKCEEDKNTNLIFSAPNLKLYPTTH